jgi:hypothetical protein
MGDLVRPCRYFDKAGGHNTDAVVQAVLERLAEGDIRTVVVASTTGYTALCFADALQDRDGVTLVSVAETPLVREWGYEYPCLKPEAKLKLMRRGVIVADKLPYLFHSSVLDDSRWEAPTPVEILRETLYAFGQGLKVAVEVSMLAAASGFVEPFQDVIAVGGTSRGADTAAVVRATFPNHAFSKDDTKRLKIREILCRPL